MEPRRFT